MGVLVFQLVLKNHRWRENVVNVVVVAAVVALAVVVAVVSLLLLLLDRLLRLHDSVTAEWAHLESKCGTRVYQRLLVKWRARVWPTQL